MARDPKAIRTNACEVVIDPTAIQVPGLGSVELTSGSGGQVTQIAVNSVNLLSAPIPYNTSLAQTAQDVVDHINRNYTSPNYFARLASTAKIEIIQRAVVTGTVTVVSTVTTMAATDTNITGGVVGDGTKLGFSENGYEVAYNDEYLEETSDEEGANTVTVFYIGGSPMASFVLKQWDADVLAARFPGRYNASAKTIEFPGTIAPGDSMLANSHVIEFRPLDASNHTLLMRKAILTGDGLEPVLRSSRVSKKLAFTFKALNDESIGDSDDRYEGRAMEEGLAVDLQGVS